LKREKDFSENLPSPIFTEDGFILPLGKGRVGRIYEKMGMSL
jgi:hypothetical protein